jgi:hypothetical protein
MDCGKSATMPAKMISEMPLPMPRSVICSPSHMMKAVPVARVSMVIKRKDQPGSCTTRTRSLVCRPSEVERDEEALHHAPADGGVAGVLVDLPLAHLALLAELLEGLEDRWSGAGR